MDETEGTAVLSCALSLTRIAIGLSSMARDAGDDNWCCALSSLILNVQD